QHTGPIIAKVLGPGDPGDEIFQVFAGSHVLVPCPESIIGRPGAAIIGGGLVLYNTNRYDTGTARAARQRTCQLLAVIKP
ncbi:MAG: hypothetical protein J4N81_14980, partial [Chloroflexi bacterium]|nr:hypothetical protein [Chloroflexota bacterium]